MEWEGKVWKLKFWWCLQAPRKDNLPTLADLILQKLEAHKLQQEGYGGKQRMGSSYRADVCYFGGWSKLNGSFVCWWATFLE